MPIVIIIAVGTFGYLLIYTGNPYMELVSIFKSAVSGPMTDRPAPDFQGISHWLNTPDNQALSLKDFQGRVVLIDFWTYTCINCQRSLPFVTAWDREYRDQGLVIIGVHTPEFRFERKLENVKAEVKKYNIEYPVALDNDYKTWRAYQNHYWPAKYLINKKGEIVYFRFGEGAYDVTEAKIQELLAEEI